MQRSSLALSLIGLRRRSVAVSTVGCVVDRLSQHSAMLVMLMAGTLAVVPSPGLPVGLVFGSVAGLVALRMLFCPGPIRLPRRLAARPMPAAVLDALARRGVPVLRRIERLTRPRLGPLVTGIGAKLAYGMVIFQSVLVALPIPFGNTLPGVAIVLLALGLGRGDGVVALAGHLVGLSAAVLSMFLVGAAITALRFAW